jgi:hypothetical protein
MFWLTQYWQPLCAGEKITLAFRSHPETLGFRRIALAERVGQVGDWALSLDDGSRLHLWLMPDGRWILHRDAVDPARSAIHAAVHVATETRIGLALIAMGSVIGFAALVAWAFKG